jgi:DNA uptake protein ComE-like DNA-binding protein
MKNSISLFIGIVLLGIVALGCQASNEKNASTDASAEATTETATNTVATVMNANLATENDLNTLGLSADLVAQILENRPFLSMNDFDALVGEDVNKDSLYKLIFVPFNINTTAEADFKMIPGVGDRMAHEFEEYRPYVSIKQFRKEIGKYVDDTEVARYEQYIFVPVELNTATEEDIKALPGVGDRMAHEFDEYRPYANMEQFRKEIGKYVDDKELARLERLVYLKN